MKRLSDREQLRRSQKRQEIFARARETFLAYLLVGCVVLTAACIAGTVLGAYMFLQTGNGFWLTRSILSSLGGAAFGWSTIQCCRGLARLKIRIERLAYAQRVDPGPLAFSDVLVRSSEEPATMHSDVLLRAGQVAHEPTTDELLRIPPDSEHG